MAGVACLTLGVGLGGFAASGYWANFLDLSKTHSGQLLGLSNSIATIPGIVGNELTGWLIGMQSHGGQAGSSGSGSSTNGTGSAAGGGDPGSGFSKVFLLAAVVYAVGALAFALTARGSPQFDAT
jgi:hypothetical protein